MMSFPTYVDPIPLPPVVTTGTTVQSYTDPLGDVWVAKNGINGGNWLRARDVLTCHAYKNSAQSISLNTYTTTIFNNVSWDPYGMVNTSTGIVTVPIAGLYHLSARMEVDITSAAFRNICTLFVNGGEARRGTDVWNSAGTTCAGMIAIDYRANANDAFGFTVYNTVAGNYNTSPILNWCCVHFYGNYTAT